MPKDEIFLQSWEKSIQTVREIFAFCLVLAEHGIYDERIEKYLSIAEKMQDRDEKSKTYGNFKWYFNSQKIVDLNSVEFSLREGLLLWIRHRERLNENTKQILEGLLKTGIKGVLNHQVLPRYTNIFLVKTWNLVAYGENFADDKIKKLAYKMLDEWLEYTGENGIREYNSPNYYFVDITALGLIYRYTHNDEIRKKSEIGLKLFWTDLALNFFEPAGRIGGSRSRDYDYIYGKDGVEQLLSYYGWLERKKNIALDYLIKLSEWKPPLEISNLRKKYPRFIERKIGARKGEWACHYIGKKFSLGCCGFCYSPLDKPLVFLFPSKDLANGYVVFDARNDPYGEKPEKQPWSGFEHKVCLHLVPFITASQHRNELIMYASIKADDPSIPRIAPVVHGFYTHFVFPSVQIFKDGKRIYLQKGEKIDIGIDDVLILKHRSAAIGIRIFHATDLSGQKPAIYLINDGNKYSVLRMTVVHSDKKKDAGTGEIGFYIAGKDDVNSKEGIEMFHKKLKKVEITMNRNNNDIEILKNSVVTMRFNPEKWQIMVDGNVSDILGFNGKDIGKKILTGAKL